MRRVVRGLDRRRTGVVLLDDSPDIRWVVRMALERSGTFQVVGEASDGANGLALVRSCQPELVLLDLTLIGSDGLDALLRLREDCPRTAVILLTASLRQDEVDAAVDLGALGVIRKGESLRSVVDQVRGLLDLRDVGPAPDRLVPS